MIFLLNAKQKLSGLKKKKNFQDTNRRTMGLGPGQSDFFLSTKYRNKCTHLFPCDTKVVFDRCALIDNTTFITHTEVILVIFKAFVELLITKLNGQFTLLLGTCHFPL